MNLIKDEAVIAAEATFDTSKKYRYSLKRTWDLNMPKVTFILLNPSIADHLICDPTFSFCINYAITNGFGQMEIVNLFAIRVTDSKEIKKRKFPVGDHNDIYILKAFMDANLVIAGWGGSNGKYKNRDKVVLDMLSDYKGKIKCFKDSRDLELPRHPSRLKSDYSLIDFY